MHLKRISNAEAAVEAVEHHAGNHDLLLYDNSVTGIRSSE
jgi:hypothetical protein